MIAEAEEIITVGKKLNIKTELLADDEAERFIQRTLDLFTPFRTTGIQNVTGPIFVQFRFNVSISSKT